MLIIILITLRVLGYNVVYSYWTLVIHFMQPFVTYYELLIVLILITNRTLRLMIMEIM